MSADVYEKAKRRRVDAPVWKKQLTKELLKPKRRRFRRRQVLAGGGIDSIWTADLLDIHQYARQNKGYKFILVVLDVFSRFAWARPLKNKSGKEVANALKNIIEVDRRRPKKLWTDEGTEFYNVDVSRVLNGIELYSTHNEPKAAIAERFIRTLREKMETNYILTQSTIWYDILPELLREYNTSKHRTIKMTPEEASKPKNYYRVSACFKHVKDKDPPSFSVGDKVRISIQKKLFDKGATANWSEEIFKVKKLRLDTNPIVYQLEDLAGEDVVGNFYKEQLQITNQEIYRVDRVLRKRGNEVLVKWSGYPDKFNSWMPSNSILQSGQDIKNVE